MSDKEKMKKKRHSSRERNRDEISSHSTRLLLKDDDEYGIAVRNEHSDMKKEVNGTTVVDKKTKSDEILDSLISDIKSSSEVNFYHTNLNKFLFCSHLTFRNSSIPMIKRRNRKRTINHRRRRKRKGIQISKNTVASFYNDGFGTGQNSRYIERIVI